MRRIGGSSRKDRQPLGTLALALGVAMIGMDLGFGAVGATHLAGAGTGAVMLACVATALLGTWMTVVAAKLPVRRRAAQRCRA